MDDRESSLPIHNVFILPDEISSLTQDTLLSFFYSGERAIVVELE